VKVYEAANLRNLALIGHGMRARLRWVSAMLITGRRHAALRPAGRRHLYHGLRRGRNCPQDVDLGGDGVGRVGQTKLNLLDTPASTCFVHEAKLVLPVVDAALVVVDGVSGVEVVTQRVWDYCNEIDLPR